MKIVAKLVLAIVGVLASAGVARAGEMVVAKVPFAFVVNGVALPAGEYVITRDVRQPELISISTVDGERRTLTLTRGGENRTNPDRPTLEFERIGTQVFLTQVTLGAGTTREIPLK